MSIHRRAGVHFQIREGREYWWWRRLEPRPSAYLYYDEIGKCGREEVLVYASSEVGRDHADDHPVASPEG